MVSSIMENILHVYWLSRLKGLGPVAIKSLIQRFGSARQVFNASDTEIVEFIKSQKTLRKPMAEILTRGRDKIRIAQQEVSSLFERAEKFQAQIISIESPTYPAILKEGDGEPPPILYVKGDTSKITDRTVAIVGTRKTSSQGSSLAYNTAGDLADRGWTIISGMARGIDASAHKGTLAVNGSTVAVLACGVEIAYPSQNKKLYEEICERGAVVSEFPFGTPPSGNNLRKRNKTTVSFSQAVILVEAPLDSGAMIAVKFAREQSKPIFCFPPKDVQREETSGVVEVLASGKGIPIHPHEEINRVVTMAVSQKKPNLRLWEMCVTQRERIALRQHLEDMKQSWLSTTLAAHKERDKGDYTGQTEALLARLRELYRSGYHGVKTDRLSRLVLQKEPSVGESDKVLRSKVTSILGMVATDIEERLLVRQCQARDRLRKREIRIVIFDLDGVLIDTRKLMESAYMEISRRHLGEDPKELDLRRVRGQSPPQAMKFLFRERYDDRMYREYKRYFSSNLANEATVPAGVKAMVDLLGSKGIALGLVTSQPHYRMLEMLEVGGFQDKFATRIDWGDTANRKPHPEPLMKALSTLQVQPRDAVYIGDDPLDIQCARNAAVTDMVALWATSYLLDELLIANPTYLLTAPDRIWLPVV